MTITKSVAPPRLQFSTSEYSLFQFDGKHFRQFDGQVLYGVRVKSSKPQKTEYGYEIVTHTFY